jgi:hypothetical protein
MTDDSRRQIAALVPKDEPSLKEYRRIVGGAVEVMIGRSLPPLDSLEVANARSEGVGSHRMTKFLLRYSGQNEELPSIRLQPKTWNHRTVIWVDRSGKQVLFTASGTLRASVQKLLANGFAVIGADLIGQGEFSDGKALADGRTITCKYGQSKESRPRYAGYTFGYNRSLFAQRVHDLLSLVAYAGSGKLAAERVDVVGLGGAGHWVAAARAVAGNAINRAAIDTAGFRFANLAASDDPDFLPGGAKYDDLPGMIALSAPYPLWLAGENGPSSSLISTAYHAAGHAEQLTVWQEKNKKSESAVVEWLLKHTP